MHIYVCKCMYIHTDIYTKVCVCMFIYMCVYVCVCMCVYLDGDLCVYNTKN